MPRSEIVECFYQLGKTGLVFGFLFQRFEGAEQRLDIVALQVLLQHLGIISVEGHTDNRPISNKLFPSNWELSSGRATTVARHLIEQGIRRGDRIGMLSENRAEMYLFELATMSIGAVTVPIFAGYQSQQVDYILSRAKPRYLVASGQHQLDKIERDKHPSIEKFYCLDFDAGCQKWGALDFTALTVDERTGTYQVRGVFENPGEVIVPGLFVRIRVPLGTVENALLIPQRAVAQDQQGKYLLVVNNDNKVERRDVSLGRNRSLVIGSVTLPVNRYGSFVKRASACSLET